MQLLSRSLVYSVVGFASEVVFSAVHDAFRQRPIRLRTSPWMFPIYALIGPLYEPAHNALRDRPLPVRATAYAMGFFAVEYTTGAALRAARGSAPWDYSYARWNVDGLIRPDYFWWWATGGLALERLHDKLTDR